MKKQHAIVLMVAVLLGTVSSPAVGAGKSSDIDELRASDAEIVKAIKDLDAQVASQQNEVASAQQSYDAAQQHVQQIEASLAEATARLEVLRNSIRDRALEEYMDPRSGQVTQFLVSDGLNEASRRNELLRQLSDKDADALDQMKALKKDIDKQREAADEGRRIAEKRRAEAQKKLDELKAARDEQAKAERILKDRINAAAGEDDASGFTGGTDDGKVSNSGVRWPVHGNHPVTSGFGSRWGRLHAGVDVGIPVGTRLYSAKDGRVTFAGPAQGYGNYVCVQHDGGLMTCYGHLSKIEVSVGQTVTQDTEIARSGNTGSSTGAHLHFETCQSNGKPACYYDKNYKNPMNYLP